MQGLIAYSARLVVMSERGRSILHDVYQAQPDKIDLIPHGIPDVTFAAPERYKDQFGLRGRKVLLTFGLLSPNKGIEHVLQALPDIVAKFPDTIYVVLGATHPHELRARGEAYRFGLEAIAANNGLQNHVIFRNQFVNLKDLTEYIAAADLYITPCLTEAQITSGTLAYAFGAGKPVISTPYWHAAELLADERGVLVPFADPKAIAREVIGLLGDESRRNAMGDIAYALGRTMVWSNTARLYLDSFDAAREQAAAVPCVSVTASGHRRRPDESPALNLRHLYEMTDSTGVFQHAKLSLPNISEGYTTDDNARALILAVLLGQWEEAPKRVRALATTYAAFLHYAYNTRTGRFHNFLNFDRCWLDEKGSEDCHGRAIWALGTAIGRSPHWSSQSMAERLFAGALPAVLTFTSPRAWAFSLIGIHEYLSRPNDDRVARGIRAELTNRLVTIFDKVDEPGWTWFEEALAYDNAKLAHALIVSGRAAGQTSVYERGIRALRWLVEVQTSEQSQFRPVGSNGFYPRNGVRADFDQQPLEAQSTVSACLEAYRATADPWWYEQAQSAFDWFLGWNDLGVELYDCETGGCCDGLHMDRRNENQGAESTLAFLLSLSEMRLIQNTATGVERAGMAAQMSPSWLQSGMNAGKSSA